MTFIIRYVWFCYVIEHRNRIFFSKVLYGLWLYILEVKAYHLEQLSCIVKIILKLLQNKSTEINHWKICFALLFSIRLSLKWNLFIYNHYDFQHVK